MKHQHKWRYVTSASAHSKYGTIHHCSCGLTRLEIRGPVVQSYPFPKKKYRYLRAANGKA